MTEHAAFCRVYDNGRCSCGADAGCYCQGCGKSIRCPGFEAMHRCIDCLKPRLP